MRIIKTTRHDPPRLLPNEDFIASLYLVPFVDEYLRDVKSGIDILFQFNWDSAQLPELHLVPSARESLIGVVKADKCLAGSL